MPRLPLNAALAAAVFVLAAPASAASLSPVEQKMAATIDADHDRNIQLLHDLVLVNSGTYRESIESKRDGWSASVPTAPMMSVAHNTPLLSMSEPRGEKPDCGFFGFL